MPKKTTSTKGKEVAEPVVAQADVHQVEVDKTVETGLVALYALQRVDSEIDKIRIVRGELPQAIQDLEDEIAGLETRISNYRNEEATANGRIAEEKKNIAEYNARREVLAEQQNNVRNNRQYEDINKEMEYKELEIQLSERHIKEANARIKELCQHIEVAQQLEKDKQEDLEVKRSELDGIIKETEEEEERLHAKSVEQEKLIDPRYLTAYKRIRSAARNGLAAVKIDRDACGGCFSKIPPQRQMEIKMHKKVIVCEHCGRILVDDDIAARAEEQLKK
ncbi:MAG: hypothetical protein IJV22_03535 [Bacteroidales bacterium]|nr:hypothetical protein [Bacteroidales bacterium]